MVRIACINYAVGEHDGVPMPIIASVSASLEFALPLAMIGIAGDHRPHCHDLASMVVDQSPSASL